MNCDFLELEPCDFLSIFLRFLPFEPHFLINFFLIKRNVYSNFVKVSFGIYRWVVCCKETQRRWNDSRYNTGLCFCIDRDYWNYRVFPEET